MRMFDYDPSMVSNLLSTSFIGMFADIKPIEYKFFLTLYSPCYINLKNPSIVFSNALLLSGLEVLKLFFCGDIT
jgi:hypothetical protein